MFVVVPSCRPGGVAAQPWHSPRLAGQHQLAHGLRLRFEHGGSSFSPPAAIGYDYIDTIIHSLSQWASVSLSLYGCTIGLTLLLESEVISRVNDIVRVCIV